MQDSPFALNHLLKSKGLATLGEAGALMSQLGYMVRDHAHFRVLLNTCDPAARHHMYEALAPNLRFKPHPLWQYMLELSTQAEALQLPTIGEGGKLEPFKVPEIASVNEAAAKAFAKERLHVVCVKCTREAVFHGVTRRECVIEARKAGWKQRKRDGKREAGCQQCTTKTQTKN